VLQTVPNFQQTFENIDNLRDKEQPIEKQKIEIIKNNMNDNNGNGNNKQTKTKKRFKPNKVVPM
jgi:hypothetical protein